MIGSPLYLTSSLATSLYLSAAATLGVPMAEGPSLSVCLRKSPDHLPIFNPRKCSFSRKCPLTLYPVQPSPKPLQPLYQPPLGGYSNHPPLTYCVVHSPYVRCLLSIFLIECKSQNSKHLFYSLMKHSIQHIVGAQQMFVE